MNDQSSSQAHSATYARTADAVASSVGDRLVIYHRVSKTAIVLNPTGSWLWEKLTQPLTVAQLAKHLQERFPSVPPEDAERDVLLFLGELTQHAMAAGE